MPNSYSKDGYPKSLQKLYRVICSQASNQIEFLLCDREVMMSEPRTKPALIPIVKSGLRRKSTHVAEWLCM
jgi:hypothetical protein